jgi:hypothetical protein
MASNIAKYSRIIYGNPESVCDSGQNLHSLLDVLFGSPFSSYQSHDESP